MSALLSFFLFCLLFIVVSVLYVGIAVYRKYRQLTDVFRRNTNNERNYRQRGNEDVVIDYRDAKTKQQKIFSDDEGEYVDYKEE